MPDMYCAACKKETAHKAIMRKNQQSPDTPLGQLLQSLGQIFSGNHYYEMEALYFCRDCNCQYIRVENEPSPETMVSSTAHASAQQAT